MGGVCRGCEVWKPRCIWADKRRPAWLLIVPQSQRGQIVDPASPRAGLGIWVFILKTTYVLLKRGVNTVSIIPQNVYYKKIKHPLNPFVLSHIFLAQTRLKEVCHSNPPSTSYGIDRWRSGSQTQRKNREVDIQVWKVQVSERNLITGGLLQ